MVAKSNHTRQPDWIGDKYSHVCLIDSQSGEVIEEGRLCTSPRPSGDALPPSSLCV